MKKSICAGIIAALFSFTGCQSPVKITPGQAPVSQKAPVPDKTNTAAHKGARTLFVIERNKNANIIHYDANLNADGQLNPAEPVIAYWVLLAEDGRRKKLNWVEKKKAYGIRIKPAPSKDGYTLTLAAAPWMPLSVKQAGDDVHAEVAINGQPAILEKMFIQAREKLLGPKVEYIELFGKDLKTKTACHEKIFPK